MIVIGAAEVEAHLSFAACIPLMRQAMIALSEGRTKQLPRGIIDLEAGNAFGVMPGAVEGGFGAKLVSVYPGNVYAGGHSHQGVVVVFDPATGAPACIVDATTVTAIRTAAASAAATDALAVPAATVRDTVQDAEIVCTVSTAHEPILFSNDIRDGTHLNIVGSSRAGPAEVDVDLVARARFFADHRASVLAQGAEFLRAKEAGAVADDHVLAEIGEVFAGTAPGRRSPRDVTLYKSLGNIVQDLACATWLHARASAQGFGTVIPL